jgi:hypothetical protein
MILNKGKHCAASIDNRRDSRYVLKRKGGTMYVVRDICQCVQVTEYKECQAFPSVIRIGSPAPPQPQASVASPPLDPGGIDYLAGEGAGGAN